MHFSYHYHTEDDFITEDDKILLSQYCKFVKTFPLYIEKEINNKKYVITHGYLPDDYKKYNPFETNKHVRNSFYWDRSVLYGEEGISDDITIICGHNPVILPEWMLFHPQHELLTIYKGEHVINVDMGCFHSKLLGAYRLEDGQCFYNTTPGIQGYEERMGE